MKLDGAWTLYYAPESDDMPMCPDQIAGSGMACITAQVPGNVEIDLMRAGLEQKPLLRRKRVTTSANMNTITGGIRRNSACPTALRGSRWS